MRCQEKSSLADTFGDVVNLVLTEAILYAFIEHRIAKVFAYPVEIFVKIFEKSI